MRLRGLMRGLWLLATLGCVSAEASLYQLGPERASRQLVIFSSADYELFEPLLAHYSRRHPTLRIDYHDLHSTRIYEQIREAQAAGQPSADVAFSSAMDLQMKLANDGYARVYRSVLTEQLPAWARWRDEAFTVAIEPAVTVYNSQLLEAADLPRNRRDLAQWMSTHQQRLYDKVTTYDAARLGVGFLLASQDAKRGALWPLSQAFASTKVKLYSNTKAMLDRVAQGRSWIAYNVLGSYALERQAEHPHMKILPFDDYKLVLSRVVVLPNNSAEPSEGEDFLNFLLSPAGQTLMEEETYFYSLAHAQRAQRDEHGAVLQPVPLGTALLVSLDRTKRERFLKRWHGSLSRP